MQNPIEIDQSLLDQILKDGTYRECILSTLNTVNMTRKALKDFLLEKKSHAPNLKKETFTNSYDTEIRNCLSKGFIIKNNENQILSLTNLGIEELKTSLIYLNNTNTQLIDTISVNNSEASNENLTQTASSDSQQLTTVRPQVTIKKLKDPYEKHILIILYENKRLARETLIEKVLNQRSIKIKTGQKACWKEIKNCRSPKKGLVKDEGGIFFLTPKGKDKAEKLVARQNRQPSFTPAKTLESIAPSDNRYLFMNNNTGRMDINNLLNQTNDEISAEQHISFFSTTTRDETFTKSSAPIAPTKMSINRILN